MNENRLEEIEIKLSFHEKAIKELNDVIYDQQKQIDRMTRLIEELEKQLPDNSTGPANEKPPHY